MKFNLTIKDLINNTGFLTTLGKTYAQDILVKIFTEIDINRESTEDLLFLGSILKSQIDNRISNIISNKQNLTSGSSDVKLQSSNKARYYY